MANINFDELALETIQSQYGASPRIQALVRAFAEKIDPNSNINLFYEKIMNLETAEGVGLDIWGVIVGVSRVLEVHSYNCFGFFGSLLQPFNQGHFFSGGSSTMGYESLGDKAFRRLIYFKALENIIPTDADSINMALSFFFEGRPVYVIEVGVMKIRYIFEFMLEPIEVSILHSYSFRPAGVGFEWYQIPKEEVFGFDGSGLSGFDIGSFDPYGIIKQGGAP